MEGKEVRLAVPPYVPRKPTQIFNSNLYFRCILIIILICVLLGTEETNLSWLIFSLLVRHLPQLLKDFSFQN